MKREFPHNTPAVVFGPIVMTADNTPAAIDLQGFGAALLLISVGVGGITFDATNKVEFTLTDSDDGSTYEAVGSGDVVLGTNCDSSVGTGGIVRSLVAEHAAATVADLSYIGGKRYLKVLANFSGTHGTGTPICVTVLKGLAHRQS